MQHRRRKNEQGMARKVEKVASLPDRSVSTEFMANFFQLTERRVRQLAVQGRFVRSGHGRYLLHASIRVYLESLRQRARDNTRGAETRRLARAQAQKLELENYARMGELQVTSQVEETCAGILNAIRCASADVPDKVSAEIAATTDAAWIYQRLQTEIHVVLHAGADYLERRANVLAVLSEPREDDPANDLTDGLDDESSD